MIHASLVIGDRSWIWPAAGIIAAAGVLLWLVYRDVTVRHGIRTSCVALKIIGIALLAMCLVEPLWSGVRARPGANIFAVLVDNSRSLTIRDPGAETSRAEVIAELLMRPESADPNDRSDWQARLEQDFDCRRYMVDARLQRLPDHDQLTFDGQSTSLNSALATFRDRYRDRPVAGILLLTDGNATDLVNGDLDASGLPPIYPVVVGDDADAQDIAIDQVAISQTSFEDAPVTIRADIVTHGYRGQRVVAEVFDEQGRSVESLTLPVEADDDQALSFRFQIRPRTAGLSFYRLRVSAEGVQEQFDNESVSVEATLENNTRLIKVDRGRGPHRVLYVSGRPNWEFKFLRRAIEGDDQIDMLGMIRIARREPKFDFRGREDETTNPLFRGFKAETDEETERYDQPVIVRINTHTNDELIDGFPKAADDLFAFKAVILDDVEAEFFSPDQHELLERYVFERGGGLLMLGGQESFHAGGYDRTPIGRMLPVYVDRVDDTADATDYRFVLSRDGWLQPWVRLRNTEEAETGRLKQMPEFTVVNRSGSIKPGAMAMAHVATRTGEHLPALVVQRYGRGRCAALTIGDFWRWRLREIRGDEPETNSVTDDSDQSKAWRQMLRWLVVDVPDRLQVDVQPQPELASNAVRIRVQTRDVEFHPNDDAAVTLSVRHGSNPPIELDAEPDTAEAGVFFADYVPREAGIYRVAATIADDADTTVDEIGSGWVNRTSDAEFQSIRPNRSLMRRLAEQTGGEIVQQGDLASFVAGLSTRKVPVTEQWTFPIWHQSWFFALAVVCLVGEWGLRRLNGLP